MCRVQPSGACKRIHARSTAAQTNLGCSGTARHFTAFRPPPAADAVPPACLPPHPLAAGKAPAKKKAPKAEGAKAGAKKGGKKRGSKGVER